MKISFVIPAYNASKTIERCITSVQAQDSSDWEAFVVDDGSKDNTLELAKQLASGDERIVVLSQKNQGPGMARNFGMKNVTGDYIAFLDSDDYIEHNYVSLVNKKISEEQLDVVIIDNYYETPEGKIIRQEKLSNYSTLDKEELIAVQMTGKMPWGGCRKVVAREIIVNNKIEYSSDPVGEEALFSFRVFYHAQRIGFLGAFVLHYVDYPASQSKKGADDPWGAVVVRLDEYIKAEIGDVAYRKEINSFAYTALIVSLYRIGINHCFKDAISLSKKQINMIAKRYPCDCNKYSLERRVKILLPFVRMRFILPIVLFSKLKNGLK